MESAPPTVAPTDHDDPPAVLLHWSARKVHPIVLLHVALVFAAFIAVASLGFRSPDAVKALALAAVGFLVPLAASVVSRAEYELTDTGLRRRTLRPKKPSPYEHVFRWDQLSHIVPMKRGLKYYKRLSERRPLRRFWKLHVSDAHSGEIHVDPADRERVLSVFSERAVPTSKPES